MKQILTIIAIALCFTAKAQNYKDSLITVQLTQRAAYYVGNYVRTQNVWGNRLAPEQLRPFIGSGTNPDSLFTVTVKADFITGMLEGLLGSPAQVSTDDRRSIVFNDPAVPGYTALATQVVGLASGNGPQKLVAQFIVDYYNQRVAAFNALRAEQISSIVTWSRN